MRVTHGVWFGLLAGALALAAPACSPGSDVSAQKDGGRGQQAAVAPVPVTVAQVVQKNVPVDIRVIGSAEAFSTVQVHAQITGELTSVNFKEGDDIKKGQVLFTLDKRPLEAALQQAQANLDKDLAQAANARVQAVRYGDLAKRGIATKEQVDQMTSTAAALDATVGADRAAVENAKVQLLYATISSPISGRTGALMVHEGNLVRATDATPLVVINQIAPIYVDFAVPEAQMAEVRRYMAAGTLGVTANPPSATASPATGRISFIDNQVDQTTGTIKMKGTFPNGDRRLWPGQFVNVVMRLTTEQGAIVVPGSAVQSGPQGQYVFVVKADQTVDLRPVEVERSAGNDAIIGKGLQPGDTVVTDGQLRLVAGSRIAVKDNSKVAP